MIKKIVPFFCCFAPLGAMAGNPYNYTSGDFTLGADATTGEFYSIGNAASQSITGAMDIEGSLLVGSDGDTNGNFYIYDITTNPFTLSVAGNVNIADGIDLINNSELELGFDGSATVVNTVNIESGSGLTLIGNSATDAVELEALNADGDFGASAINAFTVNGEMVSSGELNIDTSNTIINNGSVNIAGGTAKLKAANSITMQGVDITGDLDAKANTIQAVAVNVHNGGDAKIAATTQITLDQLQNAGTTSLSAETIETGDIQNRDTGNIIISAKNLNTMQKGTGGTGIIDNSGKMEIKGWNGNSVSIIVGADTTNPQGVIINNANGKLTISENVASLTVNGGTATNRSFVNMGDLDMNVAGTINLATGFHLVDGGTFDVTAGSLVFGSNDVATWDATFNNNLSSFKLTLTDADFDYLQIMTGATYGKLTNNTDANMEIAVVGAHGINVSEIENNGKSLSLSDGDNGTGINIGGDVAGNGGDGNITEIISHADLTVGGMVTNSGEMTLAGATVKLGSAVSNENTGTLNINGGLGTNGLVEIANDITNTGTLNIKATAFDIGGTLYNNGGTATITGSANSASSDLGALSITGGVVNLSNLGGTVNINDTMVVNGGVLNVDAATKNIIAANNINITGDIDATGANNGAVNIAVSGLDPFTLKSVDGTMTIGGDVLVGTDGDATKRKLRLFADTIQIQGDVDAVSGGELTLGVAGDGQIATINGSVTATNGAIINLDTDTTTAAEVIIDENSKIIASGTALTTTGDSVDIAGSIVSGAAAAAGDLGLTGAAFTLTSANDIYVGKNITVAANQTLNLVAAFDMSVGGYIENSGTLLDIRSTGDTDITGAIKNNAGKISIAAESITADYISNAAGATELSLLATNGDVTVADIFNNSTLNISGDTVTADDVNLLAGAATITATEFDITKDFDIKAGAFANITADKTDVTGEVEIAGNLAQTDTANTGALNLLSDMAFGAKKLTVNGNLVADKNTVDYTITGAAIITGIATVSGNAVAKISAESIQVGNVTNDGTFNLKTTAGGITTGDFTNNNSASLVAVGGDINMGELLNDNNGTLTITTDDDRFANATKFTVNNGNVILTGAGLNVADTVNDAWGEFTNAGSIVQNYGGTVADGFVDIASDNYVIKSGTFTTNSIYQGAGQNLTIYSSDVHINGDVNAQNLTFKLNTLAPNDATSDWMNVAVTGNIMGNTSFMGLEHMTVGGDYKFDSNSRIDAIVFNNPANNYWSTVSLNDDNTFGQITNAAPNAGALIEVGGKFISDIDIAKLGTEGKGAEMQMGQMGITLFESVDIGNAIWLMHANGGIQELATKVRNLNVNFCNSDGSQCFSYMDASVVPAGTTELGLPIYLSVRDSDNDSIDDSLYVVFDPRFGGPVNVFEIQPIVDRVDGHTNGEYESAGALDDLIYGQLVSDGWNTKIPIEVIPVIFQGTELETLANELYDRMEYYNTHRDGAALARFSRLFQVREMEQILGSMSLNEHTIFRSFEDRMLDEFIWNRNRNLQKAWLDFDYGWFNQRAHDGKRPDGTRWNLTGGFDWQASQTLILGLAGHVSRSQSDTSDSMNLGYRPNEFIAGHVKANVTDTDIGLGAYMMKILGNKTRVYGNAFLDMHLFDIKRDQNFVDTIKGSGTAFSLISEWGMMHDWLNQYVVGNVYARLGYNFGFDVTEKINHTDYMKMQSDGYFVLTPGYSLTAQKRIYPSVWFQIRPYATIGVEYDVLGAPDHAKYKFAQAQKYTEYDIDINPLWANIGGGVEMLSVLGAQVGLDYRYQYNSDIQLHNIKISGSYRF